jgi:hypothetical protein
MCDYSLHSVKSRPAKVGDKLTTRDLADTLVALRNVCLWHKADIAAVLINVCFWG